MEIDFAKSSLNAVSIEFLRVRKHFQRKHFHVHESVRKLFQFSIRKSLLSNKILILFLFIQTCRKNFLSNIFPIHSRWNFYSQTTTWGCLFCVFVSIRSLNLLVCFQWVWIDLMMKLLFHRLSRQLLWLVVIGILGAIYSNFSHDRFQQIQRWSIGMSTPKKPNPKTSKNFDVECLKTLNNSQY